LLSVSNTDLESRGITAYKTEDNLVAASQFKGLQCKQSIRKHSILPSQKKDMGNIQIRGHL